MGMRKVRSLVTDYLFGLGVGPGPAPEMMATNFRGPKTAASATYLFGDAAPKGYHGIQTIRSKSASQARRPHDSRGRMEA